MRLVVQEDSLGVGEFTVHLALLDRMDRFDFDIGHDALYFDRYKGHVLTHVIDVEHERAVLHDGLHGREGQADHGLFLWLDGAD